MQHIQQSSTDKYLQISSHQTENVNDPMSNGEFAKNPLWVKFEVDVDYFDSDMYPFTEDYLNKYFAHLDINNRLLQMDDSVSETGRAVKTFMISTKASIDVLNNNINNFLDTL